MELEHMFEAGKVGYIDQKLAEAKELYDTLRVTHVDLQSAYGLARNAVALMRETLAIYLARMIEGGLMPEAEVPTEFKATVRDYRDRLLKGEKLAVDLVQVFEEIRVVIPPKFTY